MPGNGEGLGTCGAANGIGGNVLPTENEYPRIILGGDKFLDCWGPQTNAGLATVGGVCAVMLRAYELGVRGFDVSLNPHVIGAFRLLKQSHPDTVAIGNPNWECGIKLGDVSIDVLRDRFRKTLLNQVFTPEQMEGIKKMPEDRQKRWFLAAGDAEVLTADEIAGIHLDEPTYRSKLEMLRGVADYVLVGTDYADWLIPLGRSNILGRMSELVRQCGFVPLSISHYTSITLPTLDTMDFEGHWVYLNRREQLLSSGSALQAVRGAIHPITAFRTLGGGALIGDSAGAFEYLKNAGVRSIVVGAERPNQLDGIIPILADIFDGHEQNCG